MPTNRTNTESVTNITIDDPTGLPRVTELSPGLMAYTYTIGSARYTYSEELGCFIDTEANVSVGTDEASYGSVPVSWQYSSGSPYVEEYLSKPIKTKEPIFENELDKEIYMLKTMGYRRG